MWAMVAATALAVAACVTAQEPVSTTGVPPTGEQAPPPTSGTLTPSTTATTSPPATTAPTPTGFGYTEIAAGLPFPVFLTALPGAPVAYLATKDGQVWVLDDGEVQPVLDIGDQVRNRGEQGLLGLALDPGDPGRLFLHYSATDGDTVLSEFRFVDPYRVDPASERVLLRIDQPAGNHNGGMVQVTSDGLLWLGLGDGGGAGDQFGHGQRPDTLLGTILRIDPDGDPYRIPADNPFVDGVDGAPEVWAWGLRNPWRFWIDEPGGFVYIADVGQDAYEEIDVVSLEDGGANFGWPITEGLHCFSPPSGCDPEGITLPVLEVPLSEPGTCAITGGVVYRGEAIPELRGQYLFSDYCAGYLRSFRWEGTSPPEVADWTDLVGRLDGVTSFGIDGAGEVYVLTTDTLYRLDPLR